MFKGHDFLSPSPLSFSISLSLSLSPSPLCDGCWQPLCEHDGTPPQEEITAEDSSVTI